MCRGQKYITPSQKPWDLASIKRSEIDEEKAKLIAFNLFSCLAHFAVPEETKNRSSSFPTQGPDPVGDRDNIVEMICALR